MGAYKKYEESESQKKLSFDSAVAKELGMSYGKYKAMDYKVKVRKECCANCKHSAWNGEKWYCNTLYQRKGTDDYCEAWEVSEKWEGRL